ncbi:MAG: hypothetical protein ACJARK_002362 [Marinobacter psychrophilus]|jgi:hypothetical protein
MLYPSHLKPPPLGRISGKLTTNHKKKSTAKDVVATGCAKPRENRINIEELIGHHP